MLAAVLVNNRSKLSHLIFHITAILLITNLLVISAKRHRLSPRRSRAYGSRDRRQRSYNSDNTLLDDEDFLNTQEGSGEGSGEDGIPEYFQSTVNFTNIIFQPQLLDRLSEDFIQLSHLLEGAIESLYDHTPGEQIVQVSSLSPAVGIGERGIMATFQLVTTDYYNRPVLFNILNGALAQGFISNYPVSPYGFTFRAITDNGIFTPSPEHTCSPFQFRCDDGACISIQRKCDGQYDCQDRSDEFNCEGCRSHEFTCSSGLCIRQELKCDGRQDCPNGSDELNCDPACTMYEFHCGSGECIDLRRKCDRQPDCVDASDEDGCVTDLACFRTRLHGL